MYRERKIQGTTNRRMSIFNPTLLPVVVNQYTKFEVSILNGCGDIFDKKSGEKEKATNTKKKTNRRMPICNPTIQLVIANLYTNLYTKFEVSTLNGCGDIFGENSGETEKRTNIGKNK